MMLIAALNILAAGHVVKVQLVEKLIRLELLGELPPKKGA
jgi:hypothetical protein